MKDWRGVIIEIAIIAAMCVAMFLDRSMVTAVVTALAAWGGIVIQRAKIDALIGTSLPPPPSSGGLSMRVPPYQAAPKFGSGDSGDSHATHANGKV